MVQWPGVVRPHRQLVDQQTAVDGLEQLDGQHPDHAEFVGQPQRQRLARRRRVRRRGPGAGAMTSTQMPSRCTVCTTGHAAPWPNGDRATSADSSRRIVTRLLDQHGDAVGQIPAGRLAGLGHVACQRHAAAVVAAADGLDHERRRPIRAANVVDVVDATSRRRTAAPARRAPPAAAASPACPGRGSAPAAAARR